MTDQGPESEVDVTRPNPARVYDYWLGGSANFQVDRELGDQMARIDPRVVPMARDNRRFLRRAVAWLCAHGVTQFLDLGAGIPTADAVHEIALAAAPHARVAYVDSEPVAVAYSKTTLKDTACATITHADLRDIDAVLAAPGVAGLLDFSQPIALLALMVLQYFPDAENPAAVLERYRRALAPGSYLALTHIAADDPDVPMGELAAATRVASTNAHPRTRAQVAALLGGGELVPPGLVLAGDWNPEAGEPPATPGVLAALARLG